MSGHTKGPWEMNENCKAVVMAGRKAVAIATNEDNVRLIAAAPDMLDALEFVLHDWHQGWKSHEAASYQMALDAIKKARGVA